MPNINAPVCFNFIKRFQTWDRKSKVSYTLQMSFISFLYSENKNVLPDTNKKIYI